MFHLGSEDKMMFWGGSYSRELELNKARRVVQLDQNTQKINERNRVSTTENGPSFKFSVIAGAALLSR